MRAIFQLKISSLLSCDLRSQSGKYYVLISALKNLVGKATFATKRTLLLTNLQIAKRAGRSERKMKADESTHFNINPLLLHERLVLVHQNAFSHGSVGRNHGRD